jgi:SEC-C motif-containing protein
MCPCGSSKAYADCCGRAHDGRPPATAEELMRSRYTAFALDKPAYLLASWHPDTRPRRVDPERGLRWRGLEVLDTDRGSMFDAEGEVEFRARYRLRGKAGEQHERSRFVRHDGAWVYWGPV